MKLFLTSSPGGSFFSRSPKKPGFEDEANAFVRRLGGRWPGSADVLIIASDPTDHFINDGMRTGFRDYFNLSKLPVSRVDMCDSRHLEYAEELDRYDVILLAGGHVPTQNRFFRSIGLFGTLPAYGGIVIGISAGTMNCAEEIYSIPEYPEELHDPDYKRFIHGLGLTKLQIIPHYNLYKDSDIDGQLIIKDIAAGDSCGRSFLVLPDGSYVLSEDGVETLYGEAYTMCDGRFEQICADNEYIVL